MEKNKTGKYLKYAIGEIILVVIGILIALQINNWNSERIANAKMTTYLQNLKDDLVSDTIAFTNNIGNYKDIINYKNKLMPLTQFENISTDSLLGLISPSYSNYNINTTTFSKITNLGLSKLSNNDSLSRKIYNYYTSNLKWFNTMINFEIEQTNVEGNYWLYQDKFEWKSSKEIPLFQDEKKNRQNLIKLITEPKGRNFLIMDFVRKKRILETYENIKKISVELIHEIQNELTDNQNNAG